MSSIEKKYPSISKVIKKLLHITSFREVELSDYLAEILLGADIFCSRYSEKKIKDITDDKVYIRYHSLSIPEAIYNMPQSVLSNFIEIFLDIKDDVLIYDYIDVVDLIHSKDPELISLYHDSRVHGI